MIPELPTIDEAGLPGFEAISWFGLMAPAGTPAAIVDKVYKQAAQIVRSSEMKERLAQLGLDTHERSAGRLRRDHQGRHRQMGEGHQGGQHQRPSE